MIFDNSPPTAARKAAPFLKWAGGKRSLLPDLRARLPTTFGAYYEPFAGGGALLFDLLPRDGRTAISDSNAALIHTYLAVRDHPGELIERLKEHAAQHSPEYYYMVRAQHNLTDPLTIAARTIYLNKTCFNGLWRVNRRGEFNVPIGRYAKPAICDAANLRACHHALAGVEIRCQDYAAITPQAGDFVYLDPPYDPVSRTASFTAYGMMGFGEKDQEALADFCGALGASGVMFMLSNSHTPFIRSLYEARGFQVDVVRAPRAVNSKASARGSVEEVIVTNYAHSS